jgi:aldose 1-epimerase
MTGATEGGGRSTQTVEIATPRARLALAPALGGGVASWEWRHSARGWVPLLRAWDPEQAAADRYRLAAFPLMPWTNRISGGGFACASGFVPLSPNRAGEPYPIHGSAWLRPWATSRRESHSAGMTLECSGPGDRAFRYHASQSFELHAGGLRLRLCETHLGDAPMPYGLGWHPYFSRSPTTRLTAAVGGVWMSGTDILPTRHQRPQPPEWDFSQGRSLSQDGLIDNCFTEWSGEARIDWPELGLALVMRSRVPYLQLYRPPQYPFFCLEPVTHPIDAVHLPGRPGLVELQRGQSLELEIDLEVIEIEG